MPARTSKSFRKKLGKKIKTLRQAQDISQAQLAFECGVRRELITRLEAGEQNTTIDTLYGISIALNTPIKNLFDFKEESR